MKIGIVANCQARPLAKVLEAFPGVERVVSLPIHFFGSAHFKKAEENFRSLIQDPDAIVLTQNLGDRFGAYETLTLKQEVEHLYTITNVHFSGLHPDITYLGDQGGRIQSPVGDYHSKIVLHSYLTGCSVDDCLQRFNEEEFEQRRYFDEYRSAANRLLERDANLDVQFAARFLEIASERPVLYTLNHPTAFVFQEFAFLIAQLFSFKAWRLPTEFLENILAGATWWPVYPPIPDVHKLKWTTPMLFRQPESLGGKLLDLESFVGACYAKYQAYGDRIRSIRQAKELLTEWEDKGGRKR